jgi:hypothetical protein
MPINGDFLNILSIIYQIKFPLTLKGGDKINLNILQLLK